VVPLKIAGDPKIALCEGDFGATVADGWLRVPAELATALQQYHNAVTATQFLSVIEAFPTALARELGWDLTSLSNAVDGLRRELDGHVPPELLRPTPRPTPGYGALDPAILKRS
jgi:hypothetical protein